MPIYHYRCSACETIHEVLAKMSDPTPKNCATCGQEHVLQKQVVRTSFTLKGGGWYREGYVGSSNQTPASTPSTPSAPSASSEGSTE